MEALKDPRNSAPNNLDKVHAEASQWFRMSSTLIWQMAAIFAPQSLACIGWAIAHPEHPNMRAFLCIASLLAFSIWAYISKLYSRTAVQTAPSRFVRL